MWSRGSKSNSTGVPTVSISVKSSSPPAGASSAARLGMLISAGLPLLLGGVLGGLGLLDLGGERLGLREQRLLLVALGLRDQLAELLLLAALGLELDDRRTPCGVGGERAVHDLVGQPALGLGGTDAVGVVSEDARVDHGRKAIRVAPRRRAGDTPAGAGDGILLAADCSTDPAPSS